ncbi:MAG: hypothetical protein K2I93_01190 [Oscillospiraceae bacterium]|nr:hypothetical protein [Oscillospiraceae bacterium]
MKQNGKLVLSVFAAALLLTACGRTDRTDNRHDGVVDDAKDMVSDVVDDGKDIVSDVAGNGKDMVSDAARDVKDAVNSNDRNDNNMDGNYRTDSNGKVHDNR